VGSKPRVLIVARDDPGVGALADGLDDLGWRTLTTRGPHASMAALADLSIEAAIIELGGEGGGALNFASRMKAACAPRRLPVIGLGRPGPQWETHGFDLILAPPLHAAQVVARLESLIRLAIAEEEFDLRAQTFAERGRRLDAPMTDRAPLRILTVGEPAPQFLSLSNALGRLGADVVGAFTAYTAFDYLQERRFEAVVLWAGDDRKEALQIATSMRRNTRLFHVPAMLYLNRGARLSPVEAFDKGVSDVASPDTDEADTARRVTELARAYRRQHAVRAALDKARSSGLMDAATGLFTRDLFASHLIRLSHASQARNRRLSVCVLKVAQTRAVGEARAGGFLDRAIPQIGSMIGRLVRAEDTGARLGAEVFALAMPDTDVAAAREAGQRIAAVIACTAFEAGADRMPFVAEFDIGAAQIQPGQSAARALEAAAAEAATRQVG